MEKSSSLFFSLKNSGLEKRLVLIYQARGFLVVGVVIVVGVVVGVVIVVGVGVVFVVVSVMVGRMVVGGLGFMLLLGLMVGIGEGLMVEIEPGFSFFFLFLSLIFFSFPSYPLLPPLPSSRRAILSLF